MSNDRLQSVLELSCEERFDYFLDVVGEEREVWILINSEEHFLKLHSDDDDIEYLPVWPDSELAAAYAGNDTDLKPRGIPLPQFLKKWLPGLKQDGIEVGVIPAPDMSVWITEPSELEQDLRDELSRF
ncbi:Protein of unknown function [Microbulbifer donghaiensis]|uniref:DUF2750 domain-containing protein n=1 Tax=Microbulbifer donghaiensis TaxID=494016 RepID=A0A1M4XFV5_9GAMM|nr:DUF2750 domain-containing protein [Microbulbifer donghaiensis]SHE92223.1 Protein of unknown function [Microbulbifer donghaiensis]